MYSRKDLSWVFVFFSFDMFLKEAPSRLNKTLYFLFLVVNPLCLKCDNLERNEWDLFYSRLLLETTSLGLGLALITSAARTWLSEPVTISVDSHHANVNGRVDFPAVAVCPVQDISLWHSAAIYLNRCESDSVCVGLQNLQRKEGQNLNL